jgi:hypothetical protein
VFGLPFDSGHVLALRVFPQGSFAAFRTLWHRDPQGRWSIFVDGPRLDAACPRYIGPACDHVGRARIDLTWTGPRTLAVSLDDPHLDWTLTVARSPVLAVLNPLSAALPLGMGRLALSGEMPSGHRGLLMPQRMHLINRSSATLSGTDLGRPTRLRENPTIGGVPLPARGVLAIGQGVWEIRDPHEYARLRDETAAASAPGESRA